MSDTPSRPRRGFGLGEFIGLAALVISGLGVWIAWQSAQRDGPTRVVEQRQPIPLTLRATAENDGRTLKIAAVEPSHALETLRLTIPGVEAIEIGNDGELDSRDLAQALEVSGGARKGSHAQRVTIDARYVEAGTDRRRTMNYVLRYRWEGGGLFGGRSLRLESLSRS